MVEDGSRAGYYFGSIGGYINLAVMIGLIIKIILIALKSLEDSNPDYLTFSIYIAFMLYAGILGTWMLSSAHAMRYSYSLYKGAKTCLILGVLSLNIFAILGGIFGRGDFKDIAVGMAREKMGGELKINPDF